jgi:phosphoribosylanthranilate isomerase
LSPTNNGQQTTDNERPLFVGVFVNSHLETVAYLLDFCQLDGAQLHGEESPEFVQHFQGRAFKALRPQSAEEAEALIQKYLVSLSSRFPASSPLRLPALLLDAYHPQLYGGTGHIVDWSMAAGIARRYPIMLAGNLTPENVTEAMRIVQPWGVDVSSGVEWEKGKKDHDKVRAFVEAVWTVSPRTEVQG